MEQKGMEYLKQKLAKFSLRGTTRYRYYDMKVNDNKRNLLMPVEIQGRYRSCIGWCSKAVDALADRLVFREFVNVFLQRLVADHRFFNQYCWFGI